jgi:hypothetical protein
VKSGGGDPRINSCREAAVRRAFKSIICTPASRYPAWLVQYFFSRLDTLGKLSRLQAGHVYEGSFGEDEGTDIYELAAGVGVGGGQRGNNA